MHPHTTESCYFQLHPVCYPNGYFSYVNHSIRLTKISVVSAFNSAQTYVSGLKLTRTVYENAPLETTNLSARTFGTWTMISAIIRFYGAYHINSPEIFQLTQLSFIIALLHFGSEWLIFKTCKLGKGLMGPLIVATTTITWMSLQREYYLGSLL